MIRVLITLPDTFEQETDILESQTDKFDKIHLRKNNWSEEKTKRFLEGLSEHLIRRIVLCDHYHLVQQYNLGGIHMKESKRTLGFGPLRHGTVSSSFHDLETLVREGPALDYALFGPVFASFSKPGYVPGYDTGDLKKALHGTTARVVGIGGIEENKTADIRSLGFAGMAFYTSFWKDHGKASTHSIVHCWHRPVRRGGTTGGYKNP